MDYVDHKVTSLTDIVDTKQSRNVVEETVCQKDSRARAEDASHEVLMSRQVVPIWASKWLWATQIIKRTVTQASLAGLEGDKR